MCLRRYSGDISLYAQVWDFSVCLAVCFFALCEVVVFSGLLVSQYKLWNVLITYGICSFASAMLNGRWFKFQEVNKGGGVRVFGFVWTKCRRLGCLIYFLVVLLNGWSGIVFVGIPILAFLSLSGYCGKALVCSGWYMICLM